MFFPQSARLDRRYLGLWVIRKYGPVVSFSRGAAAFLGHGFRNVAIVYKNFAPASFRSVIRIVEDFAIRDGRVAAFSESFR